MAERQAQGNEEKGCGMFDFLKKKDEEKSQEDVITADVERKDQGKEEKHTPAGTLQKSHSSSSSVSS